MNPVATAPKRAEQARLHSRRRVILAIVLVLVAAAITIVLVRPMGTSRALTKLILRLQGVHSEYTQVGDYRIHYFVGGEGPPVLLIHGLGSRSDDWAFTMSALRHQHRVYALDLLGHGHSDWPDIDYAIHKQTEVVRQFMTGQNINPADVVGISMGGWIGLQLTSEHPEMVRRLVLIDAAGLHFDTDLTVDSFSPKTPAELAAFYERLTPKAQPLPGFVARDLLRLMGEHSWVAHRILGTMLKRQDELDGKLRSVTMPVFIVWGKEDRITPLSLGEEMKSAMPQSSMLVLPGCGHIAFLDCWPDIKPGLVNFLAGDAAASK